MNGKGSTLKNTNNKNLPIKNENNSEDNKVDKLNILLTMKHNSNKKKINGIKKKTDMLPEMFDKMFNEIKNSNDELSELKKDYNNFKLENQRREEQRRYGNYLINFSFLLFISSYLINFINYIKNIIKKFWPKK